MPETEKFLTTYLSISLYGLDQELENDPDARKKVMDRYSQIIRKWLGAYGGRWMENSENQVTTIFDEPWRAVFCAGTIQMEAGKEGIPLQLGLHSVPTDDEAHNPSASIRSILKAIREESSGDRICLSETTAAHVNGEENIRFHGLQSVSVFGFDSPVIYQEVVVDFPQMEEQKQFEKDRTNVDFVEDGKENILVKRGFVLTTGIVLVIIVVILMLWLFNFSQ